MTPGIRKQQGLSLVELMIASVLGLLIMAGVIQLFLSSKATYRVQEGMSRVQEVGRYAVDRLSYDIRQAGYIGCGNLDRIPLNVIADDPPDFSPGRAVVGYEGGAGWTNPTTIAHVAATDVIEVRGASELSLTLTGNMAAENANIQVKDNRLGVKSGEALFITDCVAADLFRATTVSTEGGGTKVTIAHSEAKNSDNFLSKAYRADAEVMAFREKTYFVGRADGAADASLYLYDGNQALELVRGIEAFELEFGVDTNRDFAIDDYRGASSVADWNEVRSVRVALLVSTTEDVIPGAEAHSFDVLGRTVDVDDRRLRQVFSADIAVRNRLF